MPDGRKSKKRAAARQPGRSGMLKRQAEAANRAAARGR